MDDDCEYMNQELLHRVASDNKVGSFIYCPICLDKATEPILTCCGHIFCWACFYQVRRIGSTTNMSRRCPVCRADVPADDGVIPIYDRNGEDEQRVRKRIESGLQIPLRPKTALMVGSRGVSLSKVVDALKQLRFHISEMSYGTGEDVRYFKSQVRQCVESPQRILIDRCIRVLSHDTPHLARISTTLSIIVKMLVEQLDTMTTNNWVPLSQQPLESTRSVQGGQGCSSSSISKGSKVKNSGDSDSDSDSDSDRGSFFDCPICLDQSTEPIFTCCGHLFCWACFYQVRHVDSTKVFRRCPVCRGVVPNSDVIPIYVSIGEDEQRTKTDHLKIPLRPKARGVESRSPTLFPIVEQLRQLRINIGRTSNVTAEDVSYIESQERHSAEASGSPQGILIAQCLEAVSRNALVLDILPPVLSNLEKGLVEQMDTQWGP